MKLENGGRLKTNVLSFNHSNEEIRLCAYTQLGNTRDKRAYEKHIGEFEIVPYTLYEDRQKTGMSDGFESETNPDKQNIAE